MTIHSPIIKICGIRDPRIAIQTVQSGADFIGIIFHPSSKRCVSSLEKAQQIVEATREAGATPVAVFVNHTYVQMRYICEATEVTSIQLHGHVARTDHRRLAESYQRIYVQSVSSNGSLRFDDGLRYLDPDRDLILLDHIDAGQGKTSHWLSLQRPLHVRHRWLLAGGLTPCNVVKALEMLQPDGVDVSSGVEVNGEKDISLIQKFISSARGYIYAK